MSTISTPDSNRIFEEFSPRKLILQVRSTLLYILSKWWIIILFATVCGIAAGAYYYFKKPMYIAEITFALDEGVTQSPGNGFSELGAELGIGSPFDAGTIFSSITNIVELMQSRLLIEKTLRRSVEIDGKSLLFANFFLDSLEYRKKWMKGSPYYNRKFFSGKGDKKEILFENNTVRNIYQTITALHLKINKKGPGSSVISVICISENELFSKHFLEALLDEVTRYYIETKTQRAKINLALIQKRTDSVKMAYNGALYGRAAFTDAHVNPSRQKASISGERQQTDVQILRTSYVELVRNLENAKTTLMRDTPLIQYLDTPILPLPVIRPNTKNKFILFFLIGGFLMVGYLFMYRGYKYLMIQQR